MIRVTVIAPTLAVRAGLRALLSAGEGVEVIGEAARLADDFSIPGETDVLVWAAEETIAPDLQRLRKTLEATALLLLVDEQIDLAQILADLDLRSWGILTLDSSAEEMLAALQAIHQGLIVGSPAMLASLLNRIRADRELQAGPVRSRAGETLAEELIEPLTEREGEVLQLLAEGLANKQIALSLGISEHTVKFHLTAIYSKLNATSRTEAVRIGAQKGLVVL